MLTYTFMARFEKEDAGTVPDGREADCFESEIHEACMLEAVAATTACDDFGLQSFRIEADRATKKNIEAFKRDACDVGAEDTSEGVVGRCPRTDPYS